MSNINYTFTDLWVLWLIIPALILTVLPLFFMKKKHRRKLKFISSVIMRSIAVSLILLLLSGFTVTTQTELTSVVIAVDLSDSVQSSRADMQAFVNEFAQSLDKNTKIAMVGFGYNTVNEVAMDTIENALTDAGYWKLKRHPFPSSSATNIAGALDFAAQLLPDGTNKRIILLSDGMETDGYAETKAKDLALDGIRVDVIEFEPYSSSIYEVQISAVETSKNAYSGDPFTVTATLEANLDVTVNLNLYDDNVLIETVEAPLTSGRNTVDIETVAGIAGVHSLKVEVASDVDTVTANNSMYTYIKVSGDPHILIVDGSGKIDEEKDDSDLDNWKEAHELAKLLEAVDYRCTVVTAKKVPRTIAELRQYDEIILMNVNANDLPTGTDERLKEYVSRLGRGLFTTGGSNTYIYGGMDSTVYEEMLPIKMKIDDSESPTTALIILIDNSGSMDGARRNYAKRGAIASVNALNKKDYAGIIAFAMDANVVVPLTSTYDTTEIVNKIAAIQGDRQTHIYNALNEAYKQLQNAPGAVEEKRVLVLSDGEPSADDNQGYNQLVRKMRADGITVSTIFIGSDGGRGQDLMRQIASIGGGTFHVVTKAEDLPQIMLEETLSVDYVNNETFTPEISGYSQVLTGVVSIPELDGYISSSAKNNATVVLEKIVNEYENDAGEKVVIKRPIYAEWQYGLGRTASFTSDLNGAWSSKWLSSEYGVTFVRNVVSSLLPSDNESSSLAANIKMFSRSVSISIESKNKDGEPDIYGEMPIEVYVDLPGRTGGTKQLEMVMTEPGVWTGSCEISNEGVYTLRAYQFESELAAAEKLEYADHIEQAFCVSYSAEYNVFAEKTQLMATIAQLTGGISAATARELLNVPAVPMEDVVNTFTPIVIVIAILLLSDIIVRKVKIKDIKYLFKSTADTVKGLFKKKQKA